jgi:hypothetical protein
VFAPAALLAGTFFAVAARAFTGAAFDAGLAGVVEGAFFVAFEAVLFDAIVFAMADSLPFNSINNIYRLFNFHNNYPFSALQNAIHQPVTIHIHNFRKTTTRKRT